MSQVDVTVNGRVYKIACAEGQESQIARLGRYLDQKVEELARANGQVGDARLAIMAGLIIADELSETNQALAQSRSDLLQPGREGMGAPAAVARTEDDLALARALVELALRIDAVAAELERT